MRCALCIAYNGTHFFGSQVQKDTNLTILGQLENVLVQLGIEQRPIASGRTDKGVHATGQICHVDLPEFWNDLKKLHTVLNQMLPPSIHVKSIIHVSDTFHARYSAKKRVYRYIIKQESSNPFTNDFITFDKNANFEELITNIKLFEGEHDFKKFMKVGSDSKSSIRTIYKAFAYRYKEHIILYFEANGFLRSQIRLMVGALLSLNAKQIQEKLSMENNHKLKPAPSNGLYLAKIKY